MIHLSMIVRNESAIIARCLNSIFPWVQSYWIADTGSTDNTVEMIRDIADVHKVTGEVLTGLPFESFAQARNTALDWARTPFRATDGYFLLADADMELVVENKDAFSLNTLPFSYAYRMAQKYPYGVEDWNIRLLGVESKAKYIGDIHEGIVFPDDGLSPISRKLRGAYFIDHRDGANRPGGVNHAIKILEKEAEHGSRAWFHLANNYREAGRTQEAIEAYRKRIALGGDDEETYCAAVYLARCLKAIGQ